MSDQFQEPEHSACMAELGLFTETPQRSRALPESASEAAQPSLLLSNTIKEPEAPYKKEA